MTVSFSKSGSCKQQFCAATQPIHPQRALHRGSVRSPNTWTYISGTSQCAEGYHRVDNLKSEWEEEQSRQEGGSCYCQVRAPKTVLTPATSSPRQRRLVTIAPEQINFLGDWNFSAQRSWRECSSHW
ncbi:hypothetical protein PC121_g19510 [Phytophthora cactorum]|nr:hypothetical protein PC120_g19760 [Phytophthora cactorum]KAG3048399.1 hypothetical protein PC121_g19510 [Phytophthora cactorum]